MSVRSFRHARCIFGTRSKGESASLQARCHMDNGQNRKTGNRYSSVRRFVPILFRGVILAPGIGANLQGFAAVTSGGFVRNLSHLYDVREVLGITANATRAKHPFSAMLFSKTWRILQPIHQGTGGIAESASPNRHTPHRFHLADEQRQAQDMPTAGLFYIVVKVRPFLRTEFYHESRNP